MSHHFYIQYATKEYNNKNLITNDFAYDKNGNMTMDLDREIVTIQYNILNLPDLIQFKNGNQIVNKYDASGRKLHSEYYTLLTPLTVPLSEGQVVAGSYLNSNYSYINGTDYVGSIEYTFSNDQGDYQFDLDKVYNAEGYIIPVLGVPQYYYYRKDHTGDNREVWYANTNTTVQRTQYYASGLPWDVGIGASVQNRKYNGKEFIEMQGYDTYDIVWRQYYPAIGRFQTPDPEIEGTYSISPYAMCSNNMVNRTDPNGRVDFTMTKAYLKGLWHGVSSTVQATVHAVKHPVETGKKIGNAVSHPVQTGEKIANIVRGTYNNFVNGNGAQRAYITGNLLGSLAVGEGVAKGISSVSKLTKSAAATEKVIISNPVPSRLARVVPANVESKTLGAPNASDVFVTDPADIAGLNATQLSEKLTIPQSSSGFRITEFDTPSTGISTPINRSNPGFVGNGRTAGGAKEFTIPNQETPTGATTIIVE